MPEITAPLSAAQAGRYEIERHVGVPNPSAEEATELILMENFFEELKAKVGN